jgi:hypothetical protein
MMGFKVGDSRVNERKNNNYNRNIKKNINTNKLISNKLENISSENVIRGDDSLFMEGFNYLNLKKNKNTKEDIFNKMEKGKKECVIKRNDSIFMVGFDDLNSTDKTSFNNRRNYNSNYHIEKIVPINYEIKKNILEKNKYDDSNYFSNYDRNKNNIFNDNKKFKEFNNKEYYNKNSKYKNFV